MTLHWILYFGLGLSSLIFFSARFFVQWILSERKKTSHVTRIFWVFSTLGNVLLSIHYLVQIQYPLYFVRIFPLYFSVRQWSLIQKKAPPFSWKRLVVTLLSLTFLLTLLFVLRVHFEHHRLFWIKDMQMPWDKSPKPVHFLWHVFGFLGASLFMSRLWVQWWQSERLSQSVLTLTFWWISVFGALLTLTYALVINDYITALGHITGLIPYVRNIMLIKRSQSNLQTQ